jgi:hypothetical protein
MTHSPQDGGAAAPTAQKYQLTKTKASRRICRHLAKRVHHFDAVAPGPCSTYGGFSKNFAYLCGKIRALIVKA